MRWKPHAPTSACTSGSMNGGDRCSYRRIFSPAHGHCYEADIPTSTIDSNGMPAWGKFLLAINDDLIVHREHAADLTRADFRHAPVHLAADKSHQRRPAVLHDDVNRVGAERLRSRKT